MVEKSGATSGETFIGSAAHVLLDFIEKKSIDLVVMTTHGRGGLLRTALGSVSDRLLGGPAPVFLVHVEG
jgi:nucleotide-binding universal stress UspA family protein